MVKRLVSLAPLASVLLLLGGCADGGKNDPESTAAETDEWVSLFDGETFSGWRGLGRESIPAAHWVVENGTIHKLASGTIETAADGQPLKGGDILTEAVWLDFELVLEWKIARGANSGIKYNVSEPMSTAHPPPNAALGFEYQILDDDLHPDALNGPNRTTAALYDLIEPAADKGVWPVGEWNEARVVLVGSRGEHWLNGIKVLEFDLESEDFARRFEASKYGSIEGFATRRPGHIVLQDHSDDAWFRNLRIRSLPES